MLCVPRETPALPWAMPRHSPCCHSCLCAGLSAQRSPASREHLQGTRSPPAPSPRPLRFGSCPQTAGTVGIRDELLGSPAWLCWSRAAWGRCPAGPPAPPFKGRTNPRHRCGEGKWPWAEAGRALQCGGTEPGHSSCRGDPHGRLSSREGLSCPGGAKATQTRRVREGKPAARAVKSH